MIQLALQSLRLLLLMSFLTGLVYPALITLWAQLMAPWQANGSLIQSQGRCIGSQWIGQSFTGPEFFWGRPSPSLSAAYSPLEAGPSNAVVASSAYLNALRQKAQAYPDKPIPADLLMTSASGLDQDISPENAFYQAPRIAQARQLTLSQVNALIQSQIHPRYLGILGEPTVNVLNLNLRLEGIIYDRQSC